VFLADEAQQIRARVNALLAAADIAVVGESATPDTRIAGILAAHPDVVVQGARAHRRPARAAARVRPAGAITRCLESDAQGHSQDRQSGRKLRLRGHRSLRPRAILAKEACHGH
jgi:DNA-binding NarL/FixJ family response regulator